MTQLDGLYAELDRQEEIVSRIRPELDALRASIGPWLRAVASGTPMAEPVEQRQRYAALQGELWQARNIAQLRSEVGAAENRARRIQDHITQTDAEIARLASLPSSSPNRDARIQEEITALQRIRASHEAALNRIGSPRQAALVEA